jgi:Ser/Thr protein kinase RdoA (MazF antagonist)
MVSALSDLPEQRIHGDCHLGNILLSEEKVTGIIDLDHLPIGPKIYDLAYLLANRAADDTEQMAAITAGVVTGYRTAGTLDPRELAAIVPAMFAIQLQLVGWVLGNPRFATNASAHLNGYFWINEHYDELHAAVR